MAEQKIQTAETKKNKKWIVALLLSILVGVLE